MKTSHRAFLTLLVVMVISAFAAAQTTPSSTAASPSSPTAGAQNGPTSAAPPASSTAPPAAAGSESQASPSSNASNSTTPGASPAATSANPASAPGASAGSAGSPPSGGRSVEQELGLTDDQKQKLQPIIADEVQQMNAVKNDASLSTDQKRAKIDQIRQTASPKIHAILTPEQRQKLAAMQAQQQSGAPGQPASAPPQQH